MIRLITFLVFAVCGLVCGAAGDGHTLPHQNAERGVALSDGKYSYMAPSLDEGIDRVSASLTKAIAERYFDLEQRPVIKVVLFDFTNHEGNITVGSRYVGNRIRLAFADSPQFDLLLPQDVPGMGMLLTAEEFEKNGPLRERIVGEMKADVYVFGQINTSDGTTVSSRVDLWGIRPPFTDFSRISNLRELKEKEKALDEEILFPLPWRVTFSDSGLEFFNRILMKPSLEKGDVDRGKLGEVIFLSQPMCDDLNLSWQVKADGMVYDVRKESEAGTLRSRTGQIMQSRVKSLEALKELSYIIKNVGLVVNETDGPAYSFEFYMLPTKSDFYFIPYEEGETGLRFMYVWGKRGLSKNPSPHESGKGWKLNVAEQDYKNVMPLGTHMATATLEPIAESEYGTKKPRSEYVSRFKFDVLPGLNIYVVNYVFRRDRPEIFVRRLEIEGARNQPVRAVKKITEVYRVYGE